MKKDDITQIEQVVADQAQQPDQEQVSQDQEQVSQNQEMRERVQVLIPFDASRDNVRRLQAVIRSFQCYACFFFTPVVIGDRPALFKDSVTVIPFAEGAPHDMVGAVVTALQSDLVDDNFIVANIKTYLNNPLLLAHFQIPKCHADGYDLRFPVFVNKAAMQLVYDNLQRDGHPLSEGLFTLYFRMLNIPPMWLDWTKDFILLPVVSEHPDKTKLSAYGSLKAAVYVQHDLVFDELTGSLFAGLFDDSDADAGLDLYENPA